MKQKQKNHILHTPVLANEVLALLKPKAGETYLDLTAGYGGHAGLILSKTKNFKGSVLCDRDQEAIDHVKALFDQEGIEFVKNDFYNATKLLLESGRRFDIILADLGVSSPHLDKANRGFSILRDGPLDMRMDQSQTLSAFDFVNKSSETELETILRVYGEEPRAKYISRKIIEARPINSTSELANVIKSAYKTHTKSHPATKSFQALRIAVNDELGLLEGMLPNSVSLLNPGGRLGVITFQSMEDRIVKKYFNDHANTGYEATLTLINKKPHIPSPTEISSNPRARSAKLRVVSKN
ncbi:16S rRNA (cytosine(1402)-N(4))-methyltransferase RsmH [Candidatus Saccharibacteria bacterium]|nr:16S rRNA (cytosine(1402)-N(4))-methyltransferase RsmH [Candidatus Saccharibacteria bacterium]